MQDGRGTVRVRHGRIPRRAEEGGGGRRRAEEGERRCRVTEVQCLSDTVEYLLNKKEVEGKRCKTMIDTGKGRGGREG